MTFQQLSETLIRLEELGLIESSVGPSGEIEYSITTAGQEVVNPGANA